ncbi:unnamed protein product [Nesidiocoris tenuis]|uniref:Major facilitator superfamily associated domain-containing protein n=1 Tax=Nesidiocoris tenuis TaxID=355587 RepID=A0A6H5HQB9_9HEMI|nr:unnamed protein product [Nesidiocoris tenuis]
MPSKENVAEKSESPEKNEPPKNRSRFEIYCKALGINPNLLMLKITLFMMYGASASLIPFLTIHMQSIGLTVEEIAIIYLALPLTTFLSPPITGIEIEPDDNETMTDFRQHFTEEMLTAGGVNFTMLEEADLRCGGFVVATNLTYDTLKELAADCMLQICKFREGGPDICPPDYKESAPGVFWIYFVLRFLGTTMLSASVTVMDPIALTMVQQYGGEFGRERLFSTIGMAIFSPITGILIDYSSRKLGYTDYSAAFYTYSALMAVSSLSVLLIPIGTKLPADNLLRDMMKLLGLPHVIMFIFYLFLLGNCWGFIESYLFLYLKELGASNYLLGITISVGTLSSIPFLYGAEKITKKVGHVNLIVIAFFAHALRLMGYSYIDEAWWCFPFEAIESVSVHLLWVAAATYCNVIAPKNLLATLIGVLGMAHFSLGRGSGSFFGGVLIGTVGTRQAFRLMGLVAVVGGFTYGLLHFFWLHKYSEKPDKKEESASESETLKAKDDEKEEADELSTSLERLSLMIRFNHRGSLASLTGMCSEVFDIFDLNSLRSIQNIIKSCQKFAYQNMKVLRSLFLPSRKNTFPVANKPCETKLYVSPDMVCNQCPLSPSFVCRFCKAILCSFCYASIRHRHYEKFDLRLAP